MKPFKKIILSVLATALVAGMGYMYYLFVYDALGDKHTVSQEAIEQPDFLDDKQAVLHFSTVLYENLTTNDPLGFSYAVFIDDKGNASAYKMKIMEVGRVADKRNSEIMIQDKNYLRIIGKHYQELKMPSSQTVGDYSKYNKYLDSYITTFNTGVDPDTNQYDSNVLLVNELGMTRGNIPYFVMSYGMDKDELLIYTMDSPEQTSLQKVKISRDSIGKPKVIARFQNSGNIAYNHESQIISDNQYYYMVVNEYKSAEQYNRFLWRINKKTYHQERIPMSETDSHDNGYIFTDESSIHIFNNTLYCINQCGEVYALLEDEKKWKLVLTVDGFAEKKMNYDERTLFQDGYLHIFNYDENRKDSNYFLESYDLETGKKVKEMSVYGMDEIYTSAKGRLIASYDFVMLK